MHQRLSLRGRLTRRFILGAGAASVLSLPLSARAIADSETAVATVQAFYAMLLRAMKAGPKVGIAGRRDLLAPAVNRAFDLPFMARLTVGPQWTTLPPEQQQSLARAFSDYSVVTYASRFDDYSGERFDVDPKPAPSAGGNVIVRSKLVPRADKPVELDYLMHQVDGGWKIIDVYLSGTISQLAQQRSEFTSVMRQGGATALIRRLHDKATRLAG